MRTYGLIGYPLGHSFSKGFFLEKFAKEGLHDLTYENFAIPSISDFPSLLLNPSLSGLNVTIPYKEQVIKYLHWKSGVVADTGACNCINIAGGRLYGYNTDVIGFEQSLKKKLNHPHSGALILGTGGAAKAICYVLEKLSIQYLFISRNKTEKESNSLQYEDVTEDLLYTHTLVINTTPLGMYPDVNAAPPINYNALTHRHYLFDAIYNPGKTLFLQRGESMGATIQNGLDMLIIQAEESWKIWNQ